MKLPTPPDEFIRQAFRTIEQADQRNVKQGQAVPFLLLQATDGKVWKVTVSTTGQLQTALV